MRLKGLKWVELASRRLGRLKGLKGLKGLKWV